MIAGYVERPAGRPAGRSAFRVLVVSSLMADLIPHHDLKTVRMDEGGWTVYAYRGATIRSKGVHTTFTLAGHPYDGIKSGSVDLMQSLVDHWLDRQALPPGYRMPPNWPA